MKDKKLKKIVLRAESQLVKEIKARKIKVVKETIKEEVKRIVRKTDRKIERGEMEKIQ